MPLRYDTYDTFMCDKLKEKIKLKRGILMNIKYVKPENYIVIQGFMLTDLHLKGAELLVYAAVYGFCQTEEQYLTGSLQYLSEWTNCTVRNVLNCVNGLTEKGLISGVFDEKGKRCGFTVTRTSEKSSTMEKSSANIGKIFREDRKKVPTEQEKFSEKQEKSSTDNIDNIIYNINNNIKEKYKRESAQQNTPETPKKPTRHKYGTYKNVFLTDEDMEKLKSEFPDDWQNRIERLSEYIASSGKTYKNHLATIRVWAKKDKERETLKNGDKNIKWCMDKESISLDEIYGLEVAK